MTEAQARVRDAVLAGKRGRMVPPIEVWLRSPALAEKAQSLGEYCRFGTALPPRLSEIAILVSARHWRAQFEWWAHARLAREAGIGDDIIEAIRSRREPPFADAESRLVYRFAQSMLAQGRADDALFAASKAALGERGLVDLIGIVGYYALVSMTLNAYEVPTPDGSTPLD